MPYKGRFITLEGCEGVGKSTQVRLLKRYFEENGVKAVFTREPGGAPVSEQIRSIILSPGNSMDPVTELLLYAAARRQHVREIILPALKAGQIVVCDRFSDSTAAYQGYGRGLDLDLIQKLNNLAAEGAEIDVTLFFDLAPEKGFARKGGADKRDRMDSEDIAFHQRVYRGFKDIAKSSRVETIDADGTSGEVFERMIKALRGRKIIE